MEKLIELFHAPRMNFGFAEMLTKSHIGQLGLLTLDF